eukprot:XP_011665989.1 PREDICTED: uncharacterized protein LOC105439103 [Strongylocentrotus purpuratus]
MATHGGISGDLLFKLAEDIETCEQMEALGRTLGFKVAEINRYTETNRIEGRVTWKGTRDMLFDWRQTVKPCDQHLRLEQALIDAKLVMLADTHLKGTLSDPGIYRKKISASLTVERCREKLENKYRNQLCKIQMKPWDQTDYAEFNDMHTVVTMVQKNARGQDTKKKEILQGSVAEIFSTKVNGELPARILISAPIMTPFRVYEISGTSGIEVDVDEYRRSRYLESTVEAWDIITRRDSRDKDSHDPPRATSTDH